MPDSVQKVPDTDERVPDTDEEMPDRAEIPRILPDFVAFHERAILAFIDQHGHIATPEAAVLLAVKERRARAVLKDMVDQGLIAKHGNARQTVYVKAGV